MDWAGLDSAHGPKFLKIKTMGWAEPILPWANMGYRCKKLRKQSDFN
jgi:hypothetical protein